MLSRIVVSLGAIGLLLVPAHCAADFDSIELSVTIDRILAEPGDGYFSVGESATMVLQVVEKQDQFWLADLTITENTSWSEQVFARDSLALLAVVWDQEGRESLLIQGFSGLTSYEVELHGDLIPGEPESLSLDLIMPQTVTADIGNFYQSWKHHEVEPINDDVARLVAVTYARINSFSIVHSVPTPSGGWLAAACMLAAAARRR